MKEKINLSGKETKVSPALFGFTGGTHTPQIMQKAHLHQEIELNFLLKGSITYLVGGKLIKVASGRLTVFWAAVPHQTVAVENAPRFYWFTIPFAWMLQWRLPTDFTESLLHGRFFIDQPDAERDETLCSHWNHDLRKNNPESQRIVLLEMEARLRRLIQRNPKASRFAGRKTAGSVSAIQTMAEVIARRYATSLSIAEIARPTGLHPNYAMNLFRSTCGMSILNYLIQHRLFHARRLLATTDLKIIDISSESGFQSLSRFNEAFAQANDCSPRQYRQKIRSSLQLP